MRWDRQAGVGPWARIGVLGMALVPACADDGSSGASSGSESATNTAGTATSGTDTAGSGTAGATTAETSAGTGGGGTDSATSSTGTVGSSTGGAGTGSTGGSTGGGFDPIDPGTLEWEILPVLAPQGKHVRQAALSVTPSDDIVVSAVMASGSWTAPYEVNAWRLDGNAWTALGTLSAASSDEEITGTSVAALDDEVFVTYRVGVEERFSNLASGVWSDPVIEPGATSFESYEVTVDGQGRPLLLAGVDGVIRVYRRDGGTWGQLGGNVQASIAPFPGLGSLVTGAGDRVGTTAGGAVHYYDGSQWLNLGALPNAAPFVAARFAIESDGTLVAAWNDSGSIAAATWDLDRLDWTFLPGEAKFEVGDVSSPELALDAGDNLFMTWREATFNVSVGRHDDADWIPYIATGHPGGTANGGLPDIDLTSLGLPVVIWETITPSGQIGAARAVEK